MQYNPLPIILSAVGLYFLIRLKFFFILHPVKVLKKASSALREKGAFSSLALALAGTLGVGNVLGVAVGIIIGGAGSVFWLFISVFFASVLKYAEVVISSDTSRLSGERGGMFFVIRTSFMRHGCALSSLYAFFSVLLAFFMGAALQSLAVVDCFGETFGLSASFVAPVLALLVALATFRGTHLVSKITSVVIPLTTIIYILITLSVIIVNFENLPRVFLEIINSAFDLTSFGGGVFAFFFSRAFTEGYARGILSNEAGAGTSTLAHAGSEISSCASSGIMGILEVFFDTALLCMLTAFAILTSVPDPSGYSSGMALVLDAIGNSLGTPFEYLIVLCIFAFAFSTVICWYYYGICSACFIFGRRSRLFFTVVFFVFCLFGHNLGNFLLVSITDFLMLFLCLLSLSALIKNSDRIAYLSELNGITKN